MAELLRVNRAVTRLAVITLGWSPLDLSQLVLAAFYLRLFPRLLESMAGGENLLTPGPSDGLAVRG